MDIKELLNKQRQELLAEQNGNTKGDKEIQRQAESLLPFKMMDAALVCRTLGYNPSELEIEAVAQALLEHTIENIKRSASGESNAVKRSVNAFTSVFNKTGE